MTDKTLRELLEAATPGPWSAACVGDDGPWAVMYGDLYVASAHRIKFRDTDEHYGADHNAALIVALRNEAPALLDRITELEGQVEAARGDAERYRWLRERMPAHVEEREWREDVETDKRGRIISELRREVMWHYEFTDPRVELFGSCKEKAAVPTLDAAIDAAKEAP